MSKEEIEKEIMAEFNQRFVISEPDQSDRSHRYESNWFMKEDLRASEVAAFLKSSLDRLQARVREECVRVIELEKAKIEAMQGEYEKPEVAIGGLVATSALLVALSDGHCLNLDQGALTGTGLEDKPCGNCHADHGGRTWCRDEDLAEKI